MIIQKIMIYSILFLAVQTEDRKSRDARTHDIDNKTEFNTPRRDR